MKISAEEKHQLKTLNKRGIALAAKLGMKPVEIVVSNRRGNTNAFINLSEDKVYVGAGVLMMPEWAQNFIVGHELGHLLRKRSQLIFYKVIGLLVLFIVGGCLSISQAGDINTMATLMMLMIGGLGLNLIVAFASRYEEYHADFVATKLTGRHTLSRVADLYDSDITDDDPWLVKAFSRHPTWSQRVAKHC